jgi:hypothetical protein
MEGLPVQPAGQVALQRRMVMVPPAQDSGQVPPPGTGTGGMVVHTEGGSTGTDNTGGAQGQTQQCEHNEQQV